MAQLYDEFVESYHGEYKPCLTDATYLEELIHWMSYHRWIEQEELQQMIQQTPYKFIRHFLHKKWVEPICRKGIGIKRILALPYSCHPTLQ